MSVFLVPGTTNLVPGNGNIILGSFNFTFTNLGFTGANGPTSLNGYTTLPPGNLQLLNGIQYWTVPRTGLYYFKLAGAGSFNTTSADSVKAGNGVVLLGSYNLTAGTILAILVGQRGNQNGDAGGGTFIATVSSVGNLASATPLFVAGGAGGPGSQSGSNSTIDGTLSTTGRSGEFSPPAFAGAGGVGPDGGKVPTTPGRIWADGGGGFSGNGAGDPTGCPRSFVNDGRGGTTNGRGGFGGGASFGNYIGRVVGGGGGGYGGGGSGGSSAQGGGGGGGGSYSINGMYSGIINNLGSGYVSVSNVPIS
jgi:hypothetical protein